MQGIDDLERRGGGGNQLRTSQRLGHEGVGLGVGTKQNF